MNRIRHVNVAPGLDWVAVAEAGVYLQCGCVEDSVKHLIRRGLIAPVSENGVRYETGPNTILLSDIMLQGGHFSNLAEFPVLQMLYRQGMGLPGHPNNSHRRPLLVGGARQIAAQLAYIHRGNYGLISKDELLATGIDADQAELIWNLKMEFAFGEIKQPDHLVDSIILGDERQEIRNGVFIEREQINRFRISYRDESVSVDLNIPIDERYPAPYPLGFQDIKREYFSVVHSGQGDGWDINRPCMASILIYQGKIYLIDAGPNIAYCLIALGIGISEIEGIFHTHCHDDHFAGLPTLLLSDHRIKYFATPFVRASVFKKLAALLSRPEEDFYDYFEFHDLLEGVWNDINGLEVRPRISPHPVETTTLTFRTYWGGRYFIYAHLADIIASDSMTQRGGRPPLLPPDYYRRVIDDYLDPADLKKVDIGTSMIHGKAEDFIEDRSNRIILSHTALPLTNAEKEIGSSAPFGMTDVLIESHTDQLSERARVYLSDCLAGVAEHDLKQLLNNVVVKFNPGTIILKRNVPVTALFLLLTGNIEMINNRTGSYNIFTAGALIGEDYDDGDQLSKATFRTINFVHALKIPAPAFHRFIREHYLLSTLAQLFGRKEFLLDTWLFGEALSPKVQTRIAEHLHPFEFSAVGERLDGLDADSIYIVKRGALSRLHQDREIEHLESGDFFGEDVAVFAEDLETTVAVTAPVAGYRLRAGQIDDVPIVRWKLLETHQRRKRALKDT